MTAIYESRIPINFKGAMTLKVCLLEEGYKGDIRQTVDIDGSWVGNEIPTTEQMMESIQNVLQKNDIKLDIKVKRLHGENRSAGFEFYNQTTGDEMFSMDIDVKKMPNTSRVYEIGDIHFCGSSPAQMIADKLSVVSTHNVFRRIKDVLDLNYFSNVFEFDKEIIEDILTENGRELGDFDSFLNYEEDLEHAFNKYRFSPNIEKPSFKEVYAKVKEFIHDILPQEKNRDYDYER